MINARAETVRDKRTFRNGIRHGRMPLILEADQITNWLFDDSATDSILKQTQVMPEKYTKYEQLTLFDL